MAERSARNNAYAYIYIKKKKNCVFVVYKFILRRGHSEKKKINSLITNATYLILKMIND